MEYIVETRNLTKIYGKQKALDNATIHIKRGEIYGIIGKNGAGKTTLLKLLSNIANPTSGEFTFLGSTPTEARKSGFRVGTLIEDPGLYYNMDAYKNLIIKCKALGITDKNEPQRLLDLVGLSDVGKKKVGKFSMGMKQRLGMALAFMGNPDLVILDEPINGLDPEGIIGIREMLTGICKEQGTTIVISSHILEELSKVATSYAIINHGCVLDEIDSDELMHKCEQKTKLKTTDCKKTTTVLETHGIKNYTVLEEGTIEIFDSSDKLQDISLLLATQNIAVLQLSENSESLEEYYVRLVGGEENA